MKGRYLSFTAIISRLKVERVEENEHITKRARLEFGDAFASVFSYRKGSRHITMTALLTNIGYFIPSYLAAIISSILV